MILQHKGIPVFYSDTGQGDVVILLHGFLENSSMWNQLIPELAQKNRVVAVDLLGHGETGCVGYIHTMEMMAEAVKAVFDHLKIIEARIIGHSMGGYVALAFAELYPEKVNGVCLMNSTAVADSEERQINRDRAIIAVKQNHKAFISMSVSNLFAPENRERLATEIGTVKKEALKMPLQGIIAALEGMKTRKDRSVFFKDATFDKLLIVGRKDPVLDYDTLMKEFSDTDIKIVEFPYGHMSHIENYQELSYNILHFVEK